MRKILAIVLIGVLVLSTMPLLVSDSVKADTIPTPTIDSIEPGEPRAKPGRQWIAVLGGGFTQESEVILRFGSQNYTIPENRTQYAGTNRIHILVGVGSGTWNVIVVNHDDPENKVSEPFAFEVKPLEPGDPVAAIDEALLDLIDLYADTYYRKNEEGEPSWNITLDQYKAWIVAIAWSEGNRGGYAAHSQAPTDMYYHKKHGDIGYDFRFSTGIGPFQLDRGGSPDIWHKWPTIKKLNPQEAVVSTLRWHYERFNDDRPGVTLRHFSQESPWYGVKSNYNHPSRGWVGEEDVTPTWRQVTGTEWVDHRDVKNAELRWGTICEALKAPYPSFANEVTRIGDVQWDLTFTTNTGEKVTLQRYSETWLINARRSDGVKLTDYYYTYDGSLGCEIWVWNNAGEDDEFRYIFARNYTAPDSLIGGKIYPMAQYPLLRDGRYAGEKLDSAALDPDMVREPSGSAPVDVVLVIDDSGSMSWNDPTYLRRQAAEVFINAMQPRDQIGIVAFTGSATPLWNIQPIGEDRQPIIDSLKALRSSGGTNLSRALLEAYEQLKSVESSGNRKAVVFLTDGVGTYNNEAQMFGKKDWPIYVLGLGRSINEKQLQDIADDSGGAYQHLSDPNQMNAIYNQIAVAIVGGEIILDVVQRMFQGDTVLRFIQISRVLRAIFAVFWDGSMVDVTLIAPDGTVIDPSTVSPDVYHAKGLTYQMYQITNPLPGQWTIIMYGADLPPEGQDVTLQVSVVGPSVPTPSTYKFEYSVPDPIVVATDVDVDVTFMTDEEKDIGYDGVRFSFEADGPGDVTFRATDSEGVEHTFMNSGFWGPESGFDLPASYNATTTWTLNFLHKAGDYTITFSLIEAPDGDVIADITETVTVTVKPLPANVSIDPDTLSLGARGQWITAYIELPEGCVAEDVDTETVELVYGEEEPLVADWGEVQDGVFMAKFDWATVAGWFDGLHDEEVELTVAGEVDGVDFEGTATMRVIDPPHRRGGR